jgi:glycosyltransferase involved in cell wall biosynthesis
MPEKSVPDVCVVTQPARREGGKTHAHQLLDVLAAITSVSLLTANLNPDSPVRDDHEVVELTGQGTGTSLPVTVYRFLRNQLLMVRAIARRDEEAVLFFGATAYLLPIVAARVLGKTVIVEPRGDVPLSLRLQWEERMPAGLARLLAGLVSLLEHAGYTAAHAIVTYTPEMADGLGLRRYRYQRKLYPEGARYVDTEGFDVETTFEDRPVSVGYLGRLDAEKNVPTLVEVAKRLPEPIGFCFVGDGDYRETVERELAAEIKSGQVTLTGWVDHNEVPAQLNQMQLLLLSSEPTEGLPTAILESFACGTPVYATPVSGVPDVVRQDETGFLMTDQDPGAIVETIERAIEGDTLAEMSEECRGVAETEFSFEAAVGRYRHILESV